MLGATLAAAGSMAGIIVYLVLQAYFGSMVVDTASGAGAREACFLNQGLVERAVLIRFAETEEPVRDVNAIFPNYVQAYPKCPEDGTYSYVWDPQRPAFRCSVHGWHGE